MNTAFENEYGMCVCVCVCKREGEFEGGRDRREKLMTNLSLRYIIVKS